MAEQLIGVGDQFAYNKQHWMIIDIKGDKVVCKNKATAAVVEFYKEEIEELFS